MDHHPSERPTIGVIAKQYALNNNTIAGIGERYLLGIEAGGGMPALIHLTRDAAVLDLHYRRCDALLFAGGGDIAPAHFGAAPHPQLGTIEELRDEVELALARRAIADRKPVLGICRGIQLLNVALGGTLYQDIPSDLPGALDHYASKANPARANEAHTIAIDQDSWLAARLDAAELPVNTYHHQALRDVAPGLRVVARAPDGVVEAVEGTGPGFVVGVQCHPEELFERASPRWRAMFAGFVAEAAERRGRT